MFTPKGTFSSATQTVIQRANNLQALALSNIASKYRADVPQTDPFKMTFADMIAEMEAAAATGTEEQLNEKYRQFLLPFLAQVITPPQQGAQ